jgi:hypothetical protein
LIHIGREINIVIGAPCVARKKGTLNNCARLKFVIDHWQLRTPAAPKLFFLFFSRSSIQKQLPTAAAFDILAAAFLYSNQAAMELYLFTQPPFQRVVLAAE